jgi:hypothetical protein
VACCVWWDCTCFIDPYKNVPITVTTFPMHNEKNDVVIDVTIRPTHPAPDWPVPCLVHVVTLYRPSVPKSTIVGPYIRGTTYRSAMRYNNSQNHNGIDDDIDAIHNPANYVISPTDSHLSNKPKLSTGDSVIAEGSGDNDYDQHNIDEDGTKNLQDECDLYTWNRCRR